MTQKKESETVNTGGASEPTAKERAREYEIARNARRKGEDPSPDDRERGEISTADRAPPVDIDSER
jgi:hypothetical protein